MCCAKYVEVGFDSSQSQNLASVIESRCRHYSVVDLKESPCHRESSVTNLQVLVLVLGPQSPGKLSRSSHSANCPLCMITWYRHRAWGYREECLTYVLMSDIIYWYMSASKPFFTITQCCCPRGKFCPCPRGPIYKSLSSGHKSLSLSLNLKSLTSLHH